MKTVLHNFFTTEVDGSRDLPAITIPAISTIESEYHKSDLEHFDKVFQKDTLPTYHMMMDNVLHWIWNEYQNDPNKFDSDAYHTEILHRVFAFINARLYGIINPANNHAELIQILQQEYPDLDFPALIREKYDTIYDRKSEFTKDDALIWYEILPQPAFDGYQPKPVVHPMLNIEGRSDAYLVDIRRFYDAVFQYTYAYYKYMFFSKFRSAYREIDSNVYLFGDRIFDNVQGEIDQDVIDRIENIYTDTYLIRVSDFPLNVGERMMIWVASENGQYHDEQTNAFTIAVLARAEDGYYISSQRGVDTFQFEDDTLMKTGHFDTLVHKAKGTEGLRSQQWRDIMQCNAVVFDKYKPIDLVVRITHLDQYYMDIGSIGFNLLDQSDNTIKLHITDIRDLLKLWSVFEHTLDLLVKYTTDDGKEEWSLISNVYEHNSNYYLENPHITYFCYDGSPMVEPEQEVVAVVPRDGIDWIYKGREFTYIPQPINGYTERKPYLG